MPVIRYHCSKCDYEFELMRPQSKANEYVPCPKCSRPTSPSSSFQVRAQAEPPKMALDMAKGRDLPPWVRGQVEAQVRQMVKGGDAVGGQEMDIITQEVLRELSASSLEITPANIKVLAQKHITTLDSWARSARRSGAQMDAAAKMDDED